MIFLDDKEIKLGSKVLPGLILTIEITGDAKIEEAKVEGTKKIPRQATGYEDYKVTISLELGDSQGKTKEQKLAELENLFHPANKSKPIPYELINKHTQLRGIKKVIFKNLSSVSDSKNDSILVSLEFTEYERIKISVKKAGKKGKKKGKSKNRFGKNRKGATLSKKSPSLQSHKKSSSRPTTTSEYQSYLKTRGKSPSVDKSNKGIYSSGIVSSPKKKGGHSSEQ